MTRRPTHVLTALVGGMLALTACTDTLSGLDTAALGTSKHLSPVPALQASDNPITVDNRRFETSETRIGASQHPQIVRTYGGLYADPKVERTVARIVGRLTGASSGSTETYRVYLLDSPSVNAFALPGGYLYVTRGLLALADNSAELAAVIAHEMAHVIADHGIERQRRMERTEIAERVAHTVMPEREARTATARDQLDAAQFSRVQELEADEIGVKMMAEAGYDPEAALDFLDAMERHTRYHSSASERGRLDFMATHPATAQRRAKLKALVAPLRGGHTTRDRDRYLDGIDGLPFGDGSDEGYVRGRSFAHPKLGIAFDVPEGYVLENSPEAVVATGPDDVAVRFDATPTGGFSGPEAYLRSGWVAGLSEPTVRALEIGGMPAARARAFAGGYVFDVTVVRAGGRFYRFLTAAPPAVADLPARARAVTDTFRRLTAEDRAALKPLRVTIRDNAGPAQMRGVERPDALFRVLNGDRRGGRGKVVTDAG